MAVILHVCATNQVLSPWAEILTRTALPGEVVFGAASEAGSGQMMTPLASSEARRRNWTVPEVFFSRSLAAQPLERVDLLLTSTRAQRDLVLSRQHRLLRKAFTWRELAWLTDGIEPTAVTGTSVAERIDSLTRVIADRRGYLLPPPLTEFDLDLPPKLTRRGASTLADSLVAALERPLMLLRPPVA